MGNVMRKLIVHGTVIDGCGNKPIENSTVMIEDGLITYVGEFRNEHIIRADEVVDVSGKYIIPGLIESHGRLKDDYDLPEVLKSFLKRGITTVAGIAGGSRCLAFRDAVTDKKDSEFPDILLGRVVTGTNCHIKDYSAHFADGPWEVRRTVRDYAQERIDFIKDPNAVRYKVLSYEEALSKQLKVMDAAAFSLCREHDLPIVVFNFFETGSLERVLLGDTAAGTVVK